MDSHQFTRRRRRFSASAGVEDEGRKGGGGGEGGGGGAGGGKEGGRTGGGKGVEQGGMRRRIRGRDGVVAAAMIVSALAHPISAFQPGFAVGSAGVPVASRANVGLGLAGVARDQQRLAAGVLRQGDRPTGTSMQRNGGAAAGGGAKVGRRRRRSPSTETFSSSSSSSSSRSSVEQEREKVSSSLSQSASASSGAAGGALSSSTSSTSPSSLAPFQESNPNPQRKKYIPSPEDVALFADVQETLRIRKIEQGLGEQGGRSASVADWALAAGYDSSGVTLMAQLRRGQKAKALLLKRHGNVLAHFAARYKSRAQKLSYDDLIQEGSVGLMSAVEHYDPMKGARFSTYASYRVKAAVLRAIANKDRTVRVPVHIHQEASAIHRATQKLTRAANLSNDSSASSSSRFGSSSSSSSSSHSRSGSSSSISGARWAKLDDELAKVLCTTSAKIQSNRKAMQRAQSTDGGSYAESEMNAVDVGGLFAASHTSGASYSSSSIVAQDAVRRVMAATLAPRELEAVMLRFGLMEVEGEGGVIVAGGTGAAGGGGSLEPLTNKEIGARMHLSGEGIRKTVIRALNKLKDGQAGDLLAEQLLEMA